MSYPDVRATVVRRDQQRLAGGAPTSRTRFVATASQTGNDYGLFEYTLNPGDGGPGPHYHVGFSETFYVIEGELAVLNHTDWVTAGPGDLVYVPRHAVHGFRSVGDEQGARFLILFTPGIPREEYFDGLLELRAGGRTPTTAEIDEFAAQHDQINIREP